ncbi:hypothetical protein O2W17_01070 [Blastococcus sp. VKM Ac-2987]|nr:hypothetical protein [Blastococcus sp. VKM Ac-2987]MCZ2857128.1 hypothetical protein [Blastococcus sp. VKM Ac-2987]
MVTVLLGAPPGWQGTDPVVVPMTGRARGGSAATAEDVVVPPPGVVVEFDDVERRAVRALADGGLVPPLRHPDGSDGAGGEGSPGRRTG